VLKLGKTRKENIKIDLKGTVAAGFGENSLG
jgi:hypothetical protein